MRQRSYKLLVLLGIALAGAFVFTRFAQSLFYYPSRGKSTNTPQVKGLAFEEVYFSSRDGTRLHGWFIPAVGESKGVVLHVHGNAGKLGDHLGGVTKSNEHVKVEPVY